MSKSKTKAAHVYTKEHNEWIKEHPELKRRELAKKFNKKFGTNLSPVAIAKRKQRMGYETSVKSVTRINKSKKHHLNGDVVTAREVLNAIREQSRLIEKLISKM
jgi:hypothetical protein